MCSGSGQVQSDAQQTQDAQLAMTKTLNSNYNIAFGRQMGILKQVVDNANQMIANPTGAPQQTLAKMTTSVNENAAVAGKQAAGAVAAAAARGGATDVGSGAGAQIASSIYPAVAAEKASKLSDIQTANAQLKLAQQQQGREMLANAGAAYGGAAGTGAGNTAGVANSGTTAGDLSLQAGNQTFTDIATGVEAAGSVMAGIGAMKHG